MEHYLSNKLVRNSRLLYNIVLVYFAIILVYLGSFVVDYIGTSRALVSNTHMIENDSSIEVLDEFELNDTKLSFEDSEYEDITIAFYGVVTEDTNVYFNEEQSTLIMPLADGFWQSYILSTNILIVLFCTCISAIFMKILSFHCKVANQDEKWVRHLSLVSNMLVVLFIIFLLGVGLVYCTFP